MKYLLLFLFLITRAFAGEYETFDGRVYNGKFYPRVDIIEWKEDEKDVTHMEFQNYGFIAHPIDMTFELETKTGKPVMLVHYFLKNRNEHLCRRVIAPGHFKEGQLFVYRKVESDREITYVSSTPLASMAGRKLIDKPLLYAACVQDVADRGVASDEKAPEAGDQDAKRTKNAAAKDPKSVPFGDW